MINDDEVKAAAKLLNDQWHQEQHRIMLEMLADHSKAVTDEHAEGALMRGFSELWNKEEDLLFSASTKDEQ